MNELQKVELGLLKEFVDFCEKNHLKYYLSAGTCLGAIRHKGFIPWDDDIDVMMPRPDYDRFLEIGQEHFSGDIFLQTWKSDPYYPYNFSKLRDSRTTYIEKTYRFTPMNHGAWIDIFPLDGCKTPKNGKRTFSIWYHSVRTWPHMWLIFPRCITRVPSWKTCITDILIDAFFYPNYIWNINHHENKVIERIFKKYDYETHEYCINMQSGNIGKDFFPKSYLGEGKLVQFEDILARVPDNYDAYLTQLYGDYITPPPEKKQVGRHKHGGMDLHKSYKEYRKNYKKR